MGERDGTMELWSAEDLERGRRLLGRALEVPIAAIRVEAQQRRAFGDDAQERLTRSIATDGLAEPLQVYLGRLDGAGNFADGLLCAGERRLRACKSLGLESVRVMVVGLEVDLLTPQGRAQFHRRQYDENATHESLTPIEDAGALEQLMKDIEAMEPGLAKRDVVSRICQERGLSKSEMYNRLRLLNLGETLQDAVARSGLSRSQLYSLVAQWTDRVSDGWPREAAELGRKSLDRLRRRAGWPDRDLSCLSRLRVLETWEGFEQHLVAHCQESLVRREEVLRSIAAHTEAVERTEEWFLAQLRRAAEPQVRKRAAQPKEVPATRGSATPEAPRIADGAMASEHNEVVASGTRRRPPVAARSRGGDKVVLNRASVEGASRAELAEAESEVLEFLRALQAALKVAS